MWSSRPVASFKRLVQLILAVCAVCSGNLSLLSSMSESECELSCHFIPDIVLDLQNSYSTDLFSLPPRIPHPILTHPQTVDPANVPALSPCPLQTLWRQAQNQNMTLRCLSYLPLGLQRRRTSVISVSKLVTSFSARDRVWEHTIWVVWDSLFHLLAHLGVMSVAQVGLMLLLYK